MRSILMAVIAAVWMFGAGGAVAAGAGCRADTVTLRGDFGQAGFQVDVANTPQSRSKGLMFRTSLAQFSGMLFVFDHPQRAVFWMKNTPLPLDMLFVNASGVVTRIQKMTKPLSEARIDGGRGVLAVLEVNGGVADQLGLKVGDQMQNPAFKDKPVWPCD